MKVCLIADVLSPQTGWGRYAAEIIKGLLAAGIDCRMRTFAAGAVRVS